MLGLLGFLMPAGKMSRDVVNLLVSDKLLKQCPHSWLHGGRLVALNKNKEDSPPDVKPVVVGESL